MRRRLTALCDRLLTTLTLSATLTGCPDLGSRYAAEELWLAEATQWSDVAPIIEARCASCHGETPAGGATFSLLSYDEVFTWAERIRQRVIEQKDMPPGGLNEAQEFELLARWLAQGAPELLAEPLAGVTGGGGAAGEPAAGESAGLEAGAPLAGEAEPSLGWTELRPLFEIYCNTCHADPPTGGAPFPLTTLEAVRAQLERVRIRTVERMDMPPGGVRDPEDLERFRLWLEQGGPE